MHILVTGGCGFIGSNFIAHVLQADPESTVCNVDKLTYAGNLANLAAVERDYSERYSFERADIADAEAMRRVFKSRSIDAVVNFAAESHVDRSITDADPFIHSNVKGVQTLLSVALELSIQRFVHVSTDEVYGSLSLDDVSKGFTEQSPLAPNSPYAASKASGDLLCRAWHETYGFPVVITRCSNNYGPHQFPEKLIPFMYSRAMRDEPLPVYGDGQNVRDWIHVDDHCHGIRLALMQGKAGTVYNFGGNAERNNVQVVREILNFCGKPESLIRFVKDRPGHDRRYAMDYSFAQKELGFTPSRNFEEGLRDTLIWYRDNQDWMANITSGAYLSFMRDWYGERL